MPEVADASCTLREMLERFGKVLIGIYLPPLTENWKFTVFIKSLLVTLRRLDLMSCYSWNIEANGGHYLILWLNGYFHNDLSDVTPTINRLMPRRGEYSS